MQLINFGSATDNATPVKLVALDEANCVLLSNSKVICWGSNVVGQLGIGSTALDVGRDGIGFETVLVGNEANDFFQPYELVSGARTVCLRSMTNNTLKCWGQNPFQLINSNKNVGSIGRDPGEMGAALEVLPIPKVKRVDIGSSHMCALLTNGNVTCWGSNEYIFSLAGGSGQEFTGTGQLGYGTEEPGRNLTDAEALRFVNTFAPTDVILGFSTSTCAFHVGSDLHCWGSNINGELGLRNTNLDVRAPPNLPIDLGSESSPLVVKKGTQTVCVLFENGGLKCFGRNDVGQIGTGFTFDHGAGATLNEMGDFLSFIDFGTGELPVPTDAPSSDTPGATLSPEAIAGIVSAGCAVLTIVWCVFGAIRENRSEKKSAAAPIEVLL